MSKLVRIEQYDTTKASKELGLKPYSMYKVKVKAFESNPEHEAYLLTGLQANRDCYIITKGYGDKTHMSKMYSVRLVKKID